MKAAEQKKSSFEIDNLVDMAKELASDASEALPSILSKELRQLPIPRSGFEEQVESLCFAAKKGGIESSAPAIERMQQLLDHAGKTEALITLLRETIARAEDQLTSDRGQAWKIFIVQYAMLTGLSAMNAEVERAIEPIIEFMATGPREKKKAANQDDEKPVTPPAPVTPIEPVKPEEDNG